LRRRKVRDVGEVTARSQVAANGFEFSLRTAGPPGGRPVLLLHGFPQTSWCWREELKTLAAAGYRVIAPDQRGYSPGARPPATSDYAAECLVADVLALADALKLTTFDLVGHDWGGMVAWLTAARHPERVRSLCAISTPHPLALRLALIGADPVQAKRSSQMDVFRKPEVPEKLLLGANGSGSGIRSLLSGSGLPDDAIDMYVGTLSQPGALTAALNWFRANDGDEVADLPSVAAPTLYVWSTGDPAIGRAAAEATALYAIGRYTYVVLEDVSHWIPETAPELLTEALLTHLAAT
jgi:pimeloyl-ACP methyl ester carboxylesterase